MANTKYILSKLKIEGVVQDIIAKSEGDYVEVDYKGDKVTLTTALTNIIAELANLPTDTGIDSKISAAIDELIDDAPETYNTLKEIADYIADHEDVVTALNEAIGNKVDKEEGKGLSAEDFTTVLKEKLENLPEFTEADVTNWNNKVDKEDGKGLSANDFTDELKSKLENLNGVRCGVEIPEDFANGELFVQIIDTETVDET